MMLYLHLFCHMEDVEQCRTFINWINGKPLTYVLFRVGALCVPIYLFLSGYGFVKIYEKQGGGKLHVLQRILGLYANYWIVFLIFIPLACFIKPDHYPDNLPSFILNFIGWESSYNGEWWFFFPYILLVLTSPFLLRLFYKTGAKGSLTICILLFALFALCNMGERYPTPIQMPLWYITVLSMFANGVFFARFNILQRFRNHFTQYSDRQVNFLFGSSILLLFTFRICLGSSGI